MTPRISVPTAVVAAALAFGVPAALGDNWGADLSPGVPAGSPDRADRAEAARQKELVTMLDARERSLEVSRAAGAVQIAPVERPYVGDGGDRFLIGPNAPVTVAAATGSGSEIEWGQVGLGAVFGAVLMLGLLLALRTTRGRQLAH